MSSENDASHKGEEGDQLQPMTRKPCEKISRKLRCAWLRKAVRDNGARRGCRLTSPSSEQVEWSKIEMEGWPIQQAYEGVLREVEAGNNASCNLAYGLLR